MKKHIVLLSMSVATSMYCSLAYANSGLEKTNATYTYYKDVDVDGYGDVNAKTTSSSATPPSGYVTNYSDCYDSDKNIKPGATEVCNGKDDNCNGTTDDTASATYYSDRDGDGFGNSAKSSTKCKFPEFSTTNKTDCNDNYKTIYPSATEICNSKDDDCDSQIDEGVTGTVFYKDVDGDGFGKSSSGSTSTTCKAGYSSLSTDCTDDTSALSSSFYPGAPDNVAISQDGYDNNCDGYIDNCDGFSLSGSPQVKFTSPASGFQTGSSTVTTSGYILPSKSSGYKISSATIGVNTSSPSTALTVYQCSANGGARFSTTSIASATGMNSISVKGTEISGKTHTATTSLIMDSSFTDIKTTGVSNAGAGMFNQGTWNILADATEAELSSDEMEAWFKTYDPIYDYTGSIECVDAYRIKASIDNYSHSASKVTYTVSGGKVKLYAELANVDVDFTGSVYYDLSWYCGEWDDTTYYDVSASADKIYASADASFSVDAYGKLQVSLSNVASGISGFDMAIDMDEWYYDWVVAIVELFFTDEDISLFLEDALVDYIQSNVPDEIEGWLNSDDMTYTIDTGDVEYDVDFDYGSVSIPTSTVALNMNMGYDYTPVFTTSYDKGALSYSSTSYSTAETSPTFVLKTSHNFFNAALFALWEGNIFAVNNLTVDSSTKLASTYPFLPPVVTNNSASGYVLKTRIADYLVNLEVKSSNGITYKIPASFSGDINSAVNVVINGNELSFEITFDAVALTYQYADYQIPLSSTDKVLVDKAVNAAVEDLLNEASEYVSQYTINYASLPIKFSTVSVKQDVSNVNMLSIEATGSYAP